LRGIEAETDKLSHVITSVREKTQHEVQVVNQKVDRLYEGMNGKLLSYMAEVKQNYTKLSKELDATNKPISVELGEHKVETENCLGSFRQEISNLRQEIVEGNPSVSSGTEENLGRLQERVDAAERDSNSRLGEFTSKLDRLQQQVTAACRHIGQPSANTNAGVSVETGYSTDVGMFDIRYSSKQQENVCEAGLLKMYMCLTLTLAVLMLVMHFLHVRLAGVVRQSGTTNCWMN